MILKKCEPNIQRNWETASYSIDRKQFCECMGEMHLNADNTVNHDRG